MQEIRWQWSPPEKWLFRFFVIFWILTIFPFPFGAIPFAKSWNSWIGDAYDSIWQAVAPWVGDHILHLQRRITTFSNGSGDTTYNYVLLLIFVILALAGAVIWSIFDKSRPHYRKAHYWLRLLLRYYLAYVLISYGFAKIFYVQMLPPSLYELIQPFGDKSPMGLAWSYVGYSKAFSIITGWAELAGGLLLLFRRTVLIGSLLNLFVLGNVVVINFCFDVPVKIYSSTLLLITLFLLAPHAKRLWLVLVANRPMALVEDEAVVPARWRRMGKILLYVFFSCVIIAQLIKRTEAQAKIGEGRPRPPLHGIYSTRSFIKNGDTMPLLITDSSLWRNLVIEFKKNAVVKYMNDSSRRYVFIVDTVTHSIAANPLDEPKNKTTLQYKLAGKQLTLQGILDRDSVEIHLERSDANQFRLTSRGFHWINERPYHY